MMLPKKYYINNTRTSQVSTNRCCRVCSKNLYKTDSELYFPLLPIISLKALLCYILFISIGYADMDLQSKIIILITTMVEIP